MGLADPATANDGGSPNGSGLAVGLTGGQRGILWMLFAMLLFVSMDAIAKHLMQSYPTQQVMWARFIGHLGALALFLGPRLPRYAKANRIGLQLIRAALLTATTFCFFTALRTIPLANNSAIMFLAPILVTILAWPLLGERVGPRRWAGVLIGFAGAMIIVRPGAGVMEVGALFALAAAFFFAFYQIATRVLSRHDHPLTTILYTPVIGAIVTSGVVWIDWQTPGIVDGVLMAVVGMLGGIGHFAMIKAFQNADAPTITPFGYTSLIWATLFGLALFGDFPDLYTILGALLICGSGLYIFHREQVRARQSRSQPG